MVSRFTFKTFYHQAINQNSILFLDKCLHGLIIDSTGIAKQYQLSALGLYLNHKLFNGVLSFKHVDRELFLYKFPDDKWRVSTGIRHNFFDSDYNIEHNILEFPYLYHFYGRLMPNLVANLLLISTIPVAHNPFLRNVMLQNGRLVLNRDLKQIQISPSVAVRRFTLRKLRKFFVHNRKISKPINCYVLIVYSSFS